jgi:hypothetical protein
MRELGRYVFCVTALFAGACYAYGQDVYEEEYRPQFHFSPASGWIGDPDGLIKFEDKYHLFWWGHAESTDLVQAKYVFDHHDNIHVRIFVDHSILEVFIDNTVVFSCRVYPAKVESNLFDVIAESSNLEIVRMDFWNMKPMRSPLSAEVCEPDPAELPEALRKEKIVQAPVTGLEEEQCTIEVFPNPVSSKLNLYVEAETAHIAVFFADGALIKEQFVDAREIDVSDLLPGMYFLKITADRSVRIFRLSIE